MIVVRGAGPGDLEPVLAIADQRRRRYAEYQPRFWRPADDAVERQREFFRTLMTDPETLFAVAEESSVVGFVVARLVSAPPVYDPGGGTCLVDDFAVSTADEWAEAGAELLRAVRAWAAERGAAQLVVVTAQRDEPKRALLAAAGLGPASQWWVGAISAEPGAEPGDEPG